MCSAAQLVLCARNLARLGLTHPPTSLLQAWLEEVHDKLAGLTPIHAIQLLEVLNSWGVSPGECWLSDFLDSAASQAALPRYSRSKLVQLLAALADLGVKLQVSTPGVDACGVPQPHVNGAVQSSGVRCHLNGHSKQSSGGSSDAVQSHDANGHSLGLEPHLTAVPAAITAAVAHEAGTPILQPSLQPSHLPLQPALPSLHPSLQFFPKPLLQPSHSALQPLQRPVQPLQRPVQPSQPVHRPVQPPHPDLQSSQQSLQSCSLPERRAWMAQVLRTFASRRHKAATEQQLASLLSSLELLCCPSLSAWDPELRELLVNVVQATAPEGWSGQLPAHLGPTQAPAASHGVDMAPAATAAAAASGPLAAHGVRQ